jgi:hypothetical protein
MGQRVPLDVVESVPDPDPEVVLVVDESLNRLASEEPTAPKSSICISSLG